MTEDNQTPAAPPMPDAPIVAKATDLIPATATPRTPAVLPAREELQLTEENDFIEYGSDEGIGAMSADDTLRARLAIAQGMSPQVSESNAAFIPDLRIGHMFNTLTGAVYGKGPLEIAIVRRDPPRWVEFDENRNIVEKDIRPDDPRTAWRPAVEPGGKRRPPIATQFYDYIVVLLATNEVVGLSVAKSGIKVGKKLNGLISEPVPVQTTRGKTMRVVPLYAKKYTVSVMQAPVPAGQGGGTYGVFKIEYAGLITNRDLYGSLKGLCDAMKERKTDFGDAATAGESLDDDATAFPHGANVAQSANQDTPTDM